MGLVALQACRWWVGESARGPCRKGTSTEKAEHLRQQANPQLFNHWTLTKINSVRYPLDSLRWLRAISPVAYGKATQAAVPSVQHAVGEPPVARGAVQILMRTGISV